MFPERLRELRKKHHYTQQDIASKVHVSTATVGAWERGTRHPTAEAVAQLAKLFNVTTDYLLGNDEKKTNKSANINEDTNILTFEGKEIPPEDIELIKSLLRRMRENDQNGRNNH